MPGVISFLTFVGPPFAAVILGVTLIASGIHGAQAVRSHDYSSFAHTLGFGVTAAAIAWQSPMIATALQAAAQAIF